MKLYPFCKSVELVVDWNSNRPIAELPLRMRILFVSEARMMYGEILERKLNIKLVPAPEPKFLSHRIRVVEQDNPSWYSSLYHTYPHIKRQRVLWALYRIVDCGDRVYNGRAYWYDAHLRDLIMSRLIDGYEDELGFTPPNNDVREAFGLLRWVEPALIFGEGI